MLDQIAIIIQARMGSTRLRGKIIKKIYLNETILDLIIKRLKILNEKIIIATTINKLDDVIVKNAIKNNVHYFRGEEENVLKRYIDCANKFGIKKIIRITSDNIFIQPNLISPLINNKFSNIDYITYKINNKNVVLMHWGLFGEFVTIEALEKIAKSSQDKIDLEHVTYYIYNHPNEFNIKFLDVPEALKRNDIRLTIDTQSDFDICQEIVYYLNKNNLDWHFNNIIDFIDKNPEIKKKMEINIKKIQNSKKSK